MVAPARANQSEVPVSTPIDVSALAAKLEVGDVVFIRVNALPFRKIASTAQSWTNHVGIVIEIAGGQPVIAESRFPFSTITTLPRFVARSEAGRVEVRRLKRPLTELERVDIAIAARRRLYVFYDTGFNLHSRRQFCSRYVREVMQEATGVELGETEKFSSLLLKNPDTDMRFWRMWYFNHIPWQRETVSPASQLQSAQLTTVFDGNADAAKWGGLLGWRQ